jgi:hypothetical protein
VKTPTVKQYELLRAVGGPAWAFVCARREHRPLVARGWLAPQDPAVEDRMLRITPLGLRALAAALEAYGYPGASGEA